MYKQDDAALITPDQVRAGTALYTRPFLRIYDLAALGASCCMIWRCRAREILAHYNQHVSANHLDAGVGTGFFLDRCRFPSSEPRIALLDYNPNCLRSAAGRLARYRPEVYLRNILDPISMDAPPFDTIGTTNLLHCLPGNMRTKAAVFRHLKPLLNPGGKLFGATMLYGGVPRTLQATLMFRVLNRLRFMTNMEDDLAGLEAALRKSFEQVHLRTVGCEALFWASD